MRQNRQPRPITAGPRDRVRRRDDYELEQASDVDIDRLPLDQAIRHFRWR